MENTKKCYSGKLSEGKICEGQTIERALSVKGEGERRAQV